MRLVFVMMLLASVAFSQHGTREDLQKLFDDQTVAWNRGDLVGFMQAYDRSGELTFFSGDTILRGWQATLARYQQRYQAKGQDMGRLSFTDAKIEMFGPAAAMYTARWHLALQNGQKLEGLTTVICKLTKDGWRIVHDHSS